MFKKIKYSFRLCQLWRNVFTSVAEVEYLLLKKVGMMFCIGHWLLISVSKITVEVKIFKFIFLFYFLKPVDPFWGHYTLQNDLSAFGFDELCGASWVCYLIDF